MAEGDEYPTPSDPEEAMQALETDISKVLETLGVSSVEDLGWERPSSLILNIPVTGHRGEQRDPFLLQLSFAYYPKWPPSALFVNPTTKAYDPQIDQYWLPKIDGSNSIKTHEPYQDGHGNTFHGFICCSFTLGFYLARHGLEPEDHWRARPRTFYVTLLMIEKGLREHYNGRFSE